MTADFLYVPAGMPNELKALTIDEVHQHYCTHLQDFILDEQLGASYFNRFLSEPDLNANLDATKCFIHLMHKLIQLLPFNPDIQSIYSQVFTSPEEKAKTLILKQSRLDENLTKRIQHLSNAGKHSKVHEVLLEELKKDTSNIPLAEMLLELDIMLEKDSHLWLSYFNIPKIFENEWKAHLAYVHAKNANFEQAIEYWEAAQSPDFNCGDIILNHVAASYQGTCRNEEAHKLYSKSLEIDPTQLVVQNLLSELENPFIINDKALDNESIPICIYSYNKARLLEITLRSVCKSSLGTPDIIVLLNGCTDDSLDVVKRIKNEYKDIPIELLNIPINMGAPPARNYLLDHVQKTRNFKYMAYLDDDITLPDNWLKAMVTAIEEDHEIGAIGCRVLTPDGIFQQYLYRDVSIVKPGLFRLGWATPHYSKSIGLYNFRRDVDTIMGCCHLIKRECFNKVPGFDIQFSPSQLDDVAFHLDLGLNGYKVRYLGNIACTHYRATGFENRNNKVNGSPLGNDVKFYYRFAEHFEELKSRQHKRNSVFMEKLK